jgi:hypothetical protein
MLTEGQYESFRNTLISALPAGIPSKGVDNSIKDLSGKILTDDTLFALCWRLAANMETLWDNQPVLAWTHQQALEWIAVEIAEVYVVKVNGRLRNQFVFQSLSGSVVPRTIMQYWSFEKTAYLATFRDEKNNGFGFSRNQINKRGEQLGKNLFMDYRQFSGLRCFLLIDPMRSKRENAPVAVNVGHTGSTTTYNANLHTKRNRNLHACIRGYGYAVECHCCPHGRKSCELAEHVHDFVLMQKCGDCGKPGYRDKSDNLYGTICVNCANSRRKE